MWIDFSKLNSRFRQLPLQGLGSAPNMGMTPRGVGYPRTPAMAPRARGRVGFPAPTPWRGIRADASLPVPLQGFGAVAPGSLKFCNPVSDETIRTAQKALNKILDRLGYQPIATDGQLGPETCGAFTMLGDAKNAGQVTDAEWKSLPLDFVVGSAGSCDSVTLPTKKGESKPDQLSTELNRDKYALPWRVPTAEAKTRQAFINKELTAHNYQPIQETGMLDAATCGAFRLAEDAWGINYLYTYGKNCQQFVEPTPMPKGQGYQNPKDPKRAGLVALGLVGLALAGVGAVVYKKSKKRGR